MVLPLGVVVVRLTCVGQLAVTLKQPTDKSGLSNNHHSSEQVFECKEARRRRVWAGLPLDPDVRRGISPQLAEDVEVDAQRLDAANT
jgi:hypothetical protein